MSLPRRVTEPPMNLLIVLCLSAAAPLAAVTVYDLQMRLERWDYDRHAED